MPTITIDSKDLIRGMSKTDDHRDGGFSPESENINLEKSQGGILYPSPAPTDLSTNMEGEPIAFADDVNIGGNDVYILDDEGKFYTLIGTTLTKRQTDATGAYVFGTSDFKTFKGQMFATTDRDVVLLTASDLATIDKTWWSVTRGHGTMSTGYRHPLEVVEDTLYIGDKNKIHTWNGTGSVKDAMTLPTSFNITSLRVHTDGRHLMAFCSEKQDYSHTKQSRAKIYLIDTVTLEFIREIDVDDQTEGTINVGGITYVTYGNNLGYYNGSGYTFLRKLDLSGANTPLYSHGLGNKDGTLILMEGDQIMQFGNLTTDSKIFWYPIQNNTNTNPYTAIKSIGGNQILAGFATGKLESFDMDNVDSLNGNFYSNKYNFGSKVWIRKIIIETEKLADNTRLTFRLIERGTAVWQGDMRHSDDGAIDNKRFDMNVYTDLIQLRINWLAQPTKGIRKVIIYYEDAE